MTMKRSFALLLTAALLLSLAGNTAQADDIVLDLSSDTHQSTSLLWGVAGELWNPRGRLPDYSYAGYHMGEVPVPTTSIVGATNVQSFGAIPNDGNDDSGAIQSAIDSISAGVIYFPAGEYVLEKPIIIDKSNIVLVGDGDGTSAGDTKLYCPFSAEELDGVNNSHQTGKIGHFIIFDSGGKDGSNSVGNLICTVIESAKRGDRTLRVDDASGLSTQDYVLLDFSEPSDKSMWYHIHNYHEEPVFGGDKESKTSEAYLMQIERIVNDLVTFKQPFRFDVNTDWDPEIKAPLFIEEVGIENIRVQFIEVPHAAHHEEPGYNAIRFGGVMHGWARNVTVKHSDNPFRVLSQSAFITLTDIGIKGRDGHHAFNVGHASHTLISDIKVQGSSVKWTHGMTYAHTATCNVTTDVTSDQVFDLDLHSDAPFENLFENIDNWGYHSSGSSPNVGNGKWPHTGARTTYWNLAGTAGIPVNDEGELWGHIQTNLITDTTMADILSADDEWYEDMGPTMTPTSLYASQLTRRLTMGPEPPITGSGPVVGDRQNWFERDPARWQVSPSGSTNSYQLYFGDFPNYGTLGEFSVFNTSYNGDIGIYVRADSLEDFPSNPDADYALILGYQDPTNYYYARCNELLGNTQIAKVENGVQTTLVSSPTFVLTDGWNNVAFRRVGNALELLFDNTLEMTITDTTFMNGQVGLGSFDDAVRFKNINVSTSPPAPIESDFDGDSDVDGDDLNQWKANYGQSVDGDIVDGFDFLLWQRQFTGPEETALTAADTELPPAIPASSHVPGDYDDDGDVDGDDLTILLAAYGDTTDRSDFLVWQQNYTDPTAIALAPGSTPAQAVSAAINGATSCSGQEIAASLVETAPEVVAAIGTEGVYLDFLGTGAIYTSSKTGYTTYSVQSLASDWNFPDNSFDAWHVNGDNSDGLCEGDCYDSDGPAGAGTFLTIIRGLIPGRAYELHVKSFSDNTDFGFKWGLISSTLIYGESPTLSTGLYVAGNRPSTDQGAYLYRLDHPTNPDGIFFADSNGWILLYFGQEGGRTIYDGLLVNSWFDEDGDGLPTYWEVLYSLDDNDPTGVNGAAGDPDNDLLINIDEYTIGADPQDTDTDDDNLDDKEEFTGSLNPFSNEPTNPSSKDTDDDSIDDDVELIANPYITNPSNRDTDGDGVSDGFEIINGFDPTDDTDYPTGTIPNYSFPGNEVFTIISDQLGTRHNNQPSVINGYAVLAGNAVHEVWDISNPYAPFWIADMVSPHAAGEAESHQITYAKYTDDKLYMCTISGRGIDIWDMTGTVTPVLLSSLILPGINYGDVSNAVWGVSWQGTHVYVGAPSQGLMVVDVSVPSSPWLVTTVSVTQLGNVTPGPVFALGNLLVVTTPKGNRGIATLDISDPANPLLLDAVSNPSGGDSYIGGFYGTNAYLIEPLRPYDVTTNPSNIVALGQSPQPNSEYVSFADNHLFLGGLRGGTEGIWKYDITNPEAPILIGRVPGRDVRWDDQFSCPVGNILIMSDDQLVDNQYVGSVIGVHDAQPDTSAPELLYVNPPDGAVDQAVTSSIGLSFSDWIELTSINSASIYVAPVGGGAAVAGQIGCTYTTITFGPTGPLQPQTEYEIVIPIGALTDLVGNSNTVEYRSTFTTGGILLPPIEADVDPLTPTPISQQASFVVTDPNAAYSYDWDFGDGFQAIGSSVSHTYADPGRYAVSLAVTFGAQETNYQFTQVIHYPLTPNKPTGSSTVAVDNVNGRVWSVNPDNDTVTAIETTTFSVVVETVVGDHPRTLAVASDNTVWVVNQESYSISVIGALSGLVVDTIGLPHASQPYGIAFSPNGLYAYVTLQDVGQVIKINATTRTIDDTLVIPNDANGIVPKVRGVAVTSDSNTIYVSRFVSPELHGEVYEINSTAMTITKTIMLNIDPGPDAPDSARGIPNYLSSLALSPDGLVAWVPSKKDNIERGLRRDGLPLNHENTVRSIASQINLTTGLEDLSSRIDFDDQDLAVAVAFSPPGDLAFIAFQGNDNVLVFNTYTGSEIAGLPVGITPQGLALDDAGYLYVQNFLSRSLSVYDVNTILDGISTSASLVDEVVSVASEPLTAQVLAGKQLFYNAISQQLNQDSYMSCAACHLDGGSDGRVWDISNFGEGFRNTIDLRGKAGMAHGRLHWSANFDEVHDFEGQIRGLGSGTGLMDDADFNFGTRNQPLGDPKAGLSPQLDALAAYVGSLNTFGKSPYTNNDGSLTQNGLAGRVIFAQLNCQSCHTGQPFTDSPTDAMHDVGTITVNSGDRLGMGPLVAIDTPTLRGLWRTAPYLHDGSAATLGDVFATAYHQTAVTLLSAPQLDQLVDYLQQIDDAQTAAPIQSDFDFDGDVDGDDLAEWKANYGSSLGGLDFLQWQRNYTGESLAGITVTPTSGLVTTEASGADTFTVVLDAQPTANVIVGISSSDTGEGTVAPASLTFTSSDWFTAQTVTVTGVNDSVDDGDVLYTIVTAAATSGDSDYNGLDAADVSATNADDDTADITVIPTSGLVTTEAGGVDTFTVVLDSEPTADVIIGIASGNTSEGTVAPASLTFTSGDWFTAQTVTVTGVDDFVADGDALYTIDTAAATSSDSNYNGFDAANVSVTNTDIGVVVLLSSEDFEDGIGPDWVNATSGDSHDWTLISDNGGTPSNNTGPDSANGGTSYAYLECSNNGGGAFDPGDNAILESPVIGGSNRSLTFAYHMYGSEMGTLSVDVHDGSVWNNDVWTRTGEQHSDDLDPYSQAVVDLTAYSGNIQVRFRAVADGGYRGDMAIDDIEINGTASPPLLAAASNATPADIVVDEDVAPVETDPPTPSPAALVSDSSDESPSAISLTVTTGTASARPVTNVRFLIIRAKERLALAQVRQGKPVRAQRLLQELVDELQGMLESTRETDRDRSQIQHLLSSLYTELANIAAKAGDSTEETRLRELAQQFGVDG